jgi:hypothetical protein
MAFLDALGADDGDVTPFNFSPPSVGSGSLTASTVSPRTGTRAYRLTTGGTGATSNATYNIGANLATGMHYFGHHVSSLAGATVMLQLLDNGTAHLQVSVRTDGFLQLFRGPGTTSLVIGATYTVTASSWYQVAIKWVIADAGGAFDLYVNGSGTAELSFSGDTRNGANAQVNQTRYFSAGVGSGATSLDDLVWQDTTGSAPENDLVADRDLGVEYAFPDGTVSNDWTVTGGTDPHEVLDEVPHDSGGTTIDTDTAGDVCRLEYANLPVTTGTIYAVLHQNMALKSAAGLREFRSRNELSGTTVNGSTHVLSTAWLRYKHAYHRDPAGNAWTGANFNSARWDQELVT